MAKLTPDEWLKTDAFKGYTVLDPDGWDRSDFKQDWSRKLTKDEFTRKLMVSSVIRTLSAREEREG